MKMSLEKLLEKVNKTESCWVWTGQTVGRGYGKVGFRGKTARAHRVIWELLYGPIPENLFVCHKCDNPPCVNPEHLFLGNSKDNVQDMVKKGRNAKGKSNGRVLHPEKYPIGDNHYSRTEPERLARGEKHGMSKLTQEKVKKIREEFSQNVSMKTLANQFGVTKQTVWRIVREKGWRTTI